MNKEQETKEANADRDVAAGKSLNNKVDGFRALVLAAGLGSRLKPITDSLPKCLVKINGVPVLERWLRELEQAGCEEIMVNTCYMSELVESYISNRESKVPIKIAREEVLLGTAGTLFKNIDFFNCERGMLLHADNVMAEELTSFAKKHKLRREEKTISMLVFDTSTPESCGIIELDDNGEICAYHEKRRDAPGRLANGAVFMLEGVALDKINEHFRYASDFCRDVIPHILAEVEIYKTCKPFMDIGTPRTMEEADRIWRLRGW